MKKNSGDYLSQVLRYSGCSGDRFEYNHAYLIKRYIDTIHFRYWFQLEAEKRILETILSLKGYNDWQAFGLASVQDTIDQNLLPGQIVPPGWSPHDAMNPKVIKAAEGIVKILFLGHPDLEIYYRVEIIEDLWPRIVNLVYDTLEYQLKAINKAEERRQVQQNQERQNLTSIAFN